MAEQWVLVSPTAERTETAFELVDRSPGTNRRRFGFFSNNKQNCSEIQQLLAVSWEVEHGIEPRFYKKLNASAPADTVLIEQIAAECDAVITGSGDCGSCTAGTVHDSIALRRLGLPVAMLVTESFVDLARMQAHALGDDALDLVVMTHPIGGITPDELDDRAAQARTEATGWLRGLVTDPVTA